MPSGYMGIPSIYMFYAYIGFFYFDENLPALNDQNQHILCGYRRYANCVWVAKSKTAEGMQQTKYFGNGSERCPTLHEAS